MYYYYYYWSLLYSAILRFRAVSLRSHVILHEWIALYIARFWISTEVVYLQRWRHGWCHMKLLPSRRVLCTPYNHAPCHFMQSHIRKVYACLAVTCQLHFWRNDRGLLRATATITRGWNGYRNKCTSVLEMWGLLYALSESLNLSCLCLTNFMPRRKWLLLVRKSTYVGSDLFSFFLMESKNLIKMIFKKINKKINKRGREGEKTTTKTFIIKYTVDSLYKTRWKQNKRLINK